MACTINISDNHHEWCLYYKFVLVLSLALLVLWVMIISDAPSCNVTYNHHSDDSRGVIYTCNKFRVQATYTRLSKHACLQYCCINYDRKKFYIICHWTLRKKNSFLNFLRKTKFLFSLVIRPFWTEPTLQGRNYNTFYVCNRFPIVISWSLCRCQSLPH